MPSGMGPPTAACTRQRVVSHLQCHHALQAHARQVQTWTRKRLPSSQTITHSHDHISNATPVCLPVRHQVFALADTIDAKLNEKDRHT